MRRRRLYRWIGAGLLVGIGLYFVLDVVSLQYLESRAGAQTARWMSAESAKVRLGSVPFLPGFFAGHTSNVAATINGATAPGGFGVDEISCTAAKVHYSASHMFSLARSLFSTQTNVTLDQPNCVVQIAESDLSDFIKRAVPSVGEVSVKPTGVEIRFDLPQETNGYSSFPSASPAPSPSPSAAPTMSEPARYLPRLDDRRFVLTLVDVSQVPFADRDDARRIENLISLPLVPPSMQRNSNVVLEKGRIEIDSSGVSLTVTLGQAPS